MPSRVNALAIAVLALAALAVAQSFAATAPATAAAPALRSYTAWAARQLFLETRTGSLEVGKDADIAVWDRNPYRIPSTQLRDLHCEMTLLGGDTVFDARNDEGMAHGKD